MKALRQLGFLKLSLRPDGKPDEDHRVLALFRNRAELKKAYGGVQDEVFRLKDLLKQQEAATQRAQEMLNTLEMRLGAAATAYPALVFYQLRHLWQTGRELVSQLIADLVRQQDERERRVHLAQHNRSQFARREAADSALQAAQGLHGQATAQLAELEKVRVALNRWWHYFKRRALQRSIAAAEAAVVSAGVSLREAQLGVEEIARAPTPEFAGLSLPARRTINLAAIAYAEALCLRLTQLKAPMLKLAREATARRETADDYGSPRECVLLMGQIARAHTLLIDRRGVAQEIRARSERLQRVARYRNEADTTPATNSLAFTEGDVQLAGGQTGDAQVPNVLAEDTWDLFRVLLR
ncbi:MAG TPA: hypothetical protein VK128_02230 [Steroidobacteraceae bacterium]|nr:hypothetical protein [Steroidobacteraceae bacterium]